MNGLNDGDRPNLYLFLALIFLFVTVVAAADIAMDRPTTWFSVHILFEISLVVTSLGAATYLSWGWYRTLTEVGRLKEDLVRREAEHEAWRARAGRVLEGLGRAIEDQFDAWNLTNAERQTALMMLKGYSHKKIAKLTGRSERTVRQHAVAVYRKAGLAGRSELSAFFLEDILLPGSVGAEEAS